MSDLISGIFDLFWESSQQSRISDLNREVVRLKENARTPLKSDPVRAELAELRAANGELRLYVAALLRVLQTKGIVARDDLTAIIEEIDDLDGQRDRSHDGDLLH